MSNYIYDLIVIGGGSGGLAASKEAIVCGAKKVALFDYVKPTESHNTKWGLGGTCVNVGCIPKKLMHYAALMGPILHHDAAYMGYNYTLNDTHDWTKLTESIQLYIKSLNFSYRSGLRSKNIEYINALAKIADPHHVEYTDKNNKVIKLSTKYIIIAVGGRPYIPSEKEVPGAAKYAITSDDLFSWKYPPGKTLIVGGSYIALECAGFLTELGYPTTVAVRSILLRGFDRQCAEKIGSCMKEMGTNFIDNIPSEIVKLPNNKLQVKFMASDVQDEEFDTVLYAVGRRPDTAYLNLEAVGVKLDSLGKIYAENEQTAVPSIFVVGDALHNRQELTPVAIKAGELLAQRLFKNSIANMDYFLVPTCVFTPTEYGTVGFSEEQAIEIYGKHNIEVYLYEFPELEFSSVHRPKHKSQQKDEFDEFMSPNCLSKLICLKTHNMKVIGFHFVGPNAGEVTQGYALALRVGVTKTDFDNCVGIHPTNAESFHSLSITKYSGQSFTATGGCGGGKCG